MRITARTAVRICKKEIRMKIEDLTLKELIESAKDSNVSITLTMEPDRAEIQVEPWKPTYSETKWETR